MPSDCDTKSYLTKLGRAICQIPIFHGSLLKIDTVTEHNTLELIAQDGSFEFSFHAMTQSDYESKMINSVKIDLLNDGRYQITGLTRNS